MVAENRAGIAENNTAVNGVKLNPNLYWQSFT